MNKYGLNFIYESDMQIVYKITDISQIDRFVLHRLHEKFYGYYKFRD